MSSRLLFAALLVSLALGSTGCGGGSSSDPVTFPSQSVVFDVRAASLAAFRVQQASTPSVGGSTTFVSGPATPPMGTGSVQFAIGTDGNGAEELRFPDFNGTRLDEITSLTYSTFVQAWTGGGQAPYLILRLDWDGNGTQDDLLFFEPEYQNGYTVNVPTQTDLVLTTWQNWDARAGGWWSLNDPAVTAGAGVRTIDFYLTLHPNATIVAGTTPPNGGLRLVTGFGSPAWDNFLGNADALSVGVNGVLQIYNFEP